MSYTKPDQRGKKEDAAGSGSVASMGRTARMGVATLAYGTFLATITGSAIRVAFPAISEDLGASWAGIQWVSMIFLLTVTSLLASTGKLGDMYGLKRVYVLGLSMFVAGSALCGTAWSLDALIAFRVVQALGSAMTASTSPALAATVALPGQRGRAMGWIGTAVAVGLSAGPPLGGVLLSLGSWRLVFLMNLPLGIVAVAGALIFLPSRLDRSGKRPHFDLLGALLLGSGLAALLLALSYGRSWGWGSIFVVTLLVASGVLLLGFLFQERRAASPVVPISLFKNKVFASAISSASLLYSSTIGISFLVVFHLKYGLGMDGMKLGLIMAAQPLGSALSAPFSGRASDKIGSRMLVTVGAGLVTTSMALLWFTCDSATPWAIACPLALTGLGFGIYGSPNSSAILGAAPKHLLGVAGGVLATARTLGMAIGVAVAGAVFGAAFASATGGLEINAYQSSMFPALVTGLRASLSVSGVVACVAMVLAFLRGPDKKVVARPGEICEPPEPCG